MITDKQIVDTLGVYNSLGVLKEEIRSYEVSLWTLQDEFITVLKWSDVEQKGRIENPKMKLSIDGTQEFTFDIPMYYSINGVKVINPNWYNIENENESGNLITSTRKVKVIFNKGTDDQAVFEFLIIDVQETHENEDLTCSLKCEGLAFHELGKVGYRYHLSQEVYEEEYKEWAQTHKGFTPAPIQNIDYWCKKINLTPYPNDPTLVNSTKWYYRVQMSWKSFRTGRVRISDKIYENEYTSAYDTELRPSATNVTLREKARAIETENSNIYNITQTLAETFGVFCKYDYLYDENYHIVARIVTFYNSFLKEDDDLITLSYPHTSNKISREMDATNLTTKLYVLDIDDDTSYTGYRSIMDSEANKMRENYVFNFDYMKAVGNITDEQLKGIKTFEKKIKVLNDKLIQLSSNIQAYNELIPKLEAQSAVHKKAQTTALEQIEQNGALRAALSEEYGDGSGYITLPTPDQKLIVSDKEKGNVINFTDDKKGIVQGTLHIYRTYNSTTNTLSDEITDFTVDTDEYGNVTGVRGLPQPSGSATVYLMYTYNPTLYYDAIIKTWEVRLGIDTVEYDKIITRLGDENYNPTTDDVEVSNAYATLGNWLQGALEDGTVESNYYKRPHLLDDNNNIMTYYSMSASNSSGTRHVLVTPILPSGEMMPKRIALQFATKYAENQININSQLEYNKTTFLFSDIYMGTFASASRATSVGQAYSAYHAAVINATTGGLRKRDKDAKAMVEALLRKKDELIHNFESMLGPTLREGYWQPEDYRNYGEQKTFSKAMSMTSSSIEMTSETGKDMNLGWEADPNLFDGEEDIHYNVGLTENRETYPCINLSEIWDQIHTKLDDYSFIYTSNYLEEEFNENDIKNLTIYKFGSKAIIRFIRNGSKIYPALVLIGAKTLSGDKNDPTTPLGFFYSEKANPRLAIVKTTVNSDTGVATTSITGAISVSDEAYWKFNNKAATQCNVVYPRIKCSSLDLKTDTDNLVIHYNNKLLNQYEHYYINMRNVERNGNYYAEYFITLKPEAIYKNGLSNTVEVNYVISNANTSIYLDAIEVAKENAFPKVSYEVSPNILSHDLSRILYSKLAQILMINDTDLKLQNTFGYISDLELNLDDVTADTITIKNYKTKFEDLFSSIIAQTEAMKRASTDLSAVGSGNMTLSGEGLASTLDANAAIMNAYLDSYFDSSDVVYDRLTDIFYEAGQILGGANETLNKMQGLSTQNASILAGFAENVAKALTIKVYRSQTKPDSFKTGDVWIQTDANGNEVGRYVATSNGSGGEGTKGFVRTWDGTLAQINGESLNIDAVAGIIDIEARNQINIKSGHSVYIAAGEDVDIVCNRSVNLGGTEINIASLHVQDADGNDTGEIAPVTGINLVAGGLDKIGDGQTSQILIRPTQMDFLSSDIRMKAASSIELIASTGDASGTSAISISANNGVWIGAGAGLRLYSGTAADHIWVGPKHKPKYQAGDIWVRVTQVGNNGHNSYDGDPSLSNELTNYYKNFLEKGQGSGTYAGTYIANTSWEEQYNYDETAAVAGANSTTGWTRKDGIISLNDVNNAMGASVELNTEHLLFGFSNVKHNSANTSAIEMTEEHIIFAVGQGFENFASRDITGLNSGLTGVKITRDSIGMAVENGNALTAVIMNAHGFSVGSGFTNTNLATADRETLREAVAGNDKGSYVRIDPDGIELGSLAGLYINTDNFKLQTNTRDPQNNVNFVNGETIMAIGSKLQSIGYDTTVDMSAADGKWHFYNGEDKIIDSSNKEPEIRLLVNQHGLYLRGNVYASNGVFNGTVYATGGQFTGDIVANSIYLVDAEDTEGEHDLQTYLAALQSQVDGEIDTWHDQVDPTPNDKDPEHDSMSAAANAPAVDWNTQKLKEKHYGDIYYNDKTGEAFKWLKNNTNTFYWKSISDTEFSNVNKRVTDVNIRVGEVADGTTGLAFAATGTNTFVSLNKESGLVIMGKRITETGFDDIDQYVGWYPYFRASNNAMGFFYCQNPSSAAAITDNDVAKLYYDNGDLYIAGTLIASNIYIKGSGNERVQWGDYWTTQKTGWRGEVTTQITQLFDEAGTILATGSQALADNSQQIVAAHEELTNFLASAKQLKPKKSTGKNPPTTFKPGDVWWPSKANSELGTKVGDRFIAISYSDALVNSNDEYDNANNKLRGWNKTQDGSLASISGAGMDIDTAAGTLDLYAGSKMTLKAKSQLDLASGDIQITGNNSINIGSKWINIGSTDGGINITATNISASDTAKDENTGRAVGASHIIIDRNGIDVNTSSKIKVHSSSAIEVMATANNTEGSVVTINNEGIKLLSTGTIQLSSSADKDGTGGIQGTNFIMTKDHLMFGAKNATSSSSTAIRMDADQIIIAAGKTAYDYQDGSTYEITKDTNGTVGMQFRKNYIGLATGSANARTLIAMRPNKLLFGIGIESETNYTTGSYIIMKEVDKTVNDVTEKHAAIVIASSAYFRLLSPHLLIDNMSGSSIGEDNDANQLTKVAFYLASTDTWTSSTKGIVFHNNSLKIQANEIHVAANKLYFGTKTASETLSDEMDETVVSTIKLYYTSNVATAANVAKPNVNTRQNWTTTLQAADPTNKYVYSVIEITKKGGEVSYTDVQSEGQLAKLTKVTYRKYKRAASGDSNKPSITDANRDTWSLGIPAANKIIKVQDDGSHYVDSSNGYETNDKSTWIVTDPWVWSTDVTEYKDGTYTYTDPVHEYEYDDTASKIAQVTDMIDGKIPIPYVKSSGLTIDGNYVSLQSTGTLTLFSGSQLLIGTRVVDQATGAKQSTIALNANGIYLNTTAGTNAITMDENGITLASGKKLIIDTTNFSIDSSGNVSMTGNVTASSGSIGPWTVTADGLTRSVDGKTAYIHNVYNNRAYAFRANDKFWVDYDGNCWIQSLYVDGQFVDFTSFYDAVSISATGWSGESLQMRARLYNKLDSKYSYAGAGADCDGSGVAYYSAYGTGYANVHIDVTINGAGTKRFERQIRMNTDQPFIDGWQAAAQDIPTSLAGTETSISIPSSVANAYTSLSLTPVYSQGYSNGYLDGWNEALAACTAVSDAYQAGTTNTYYNAGTSATYYDSSGNTVSVTLQGSSVSVTEQGATYTGLYKKPGSGSGGGCFIAGTQVLLANGHTLSIELLQLDMQVLAYDEQNDTYIPAAVTQVSAYEHKSNIVDIVLSNNEIITATKSHPFLTINGWAAVDPETSRQDQNYVDPIELKIGDYLVNNLQENIYIKDIVERIDLQDITVYNCAISTYNTFLVKNVVVHNAKVN